MATVFYVVGLTCKRTNARKERPDHGVVQNTDHGENYIAAMLTWLFSAYAVSAENVYQCKGCGLESEELPM